jgi:hypothetical protein
LRAPSTLCRAQPLVTPYFCALCGLYATSEEQLRMHMLGKRHTRMAALTRQRGAQGMVAAAPSGAATPQSAALLAAGGGGPAAAAAWPEPGAVSNGSPQVSLQQQQHQLLTAAAAAAAAASSLEMRGPFSPPMPGPGGISASVVVSSGPVADTPFASPMGLAAAPFPTASAAAPYSVGGWPGEASGGAGPPGGFDLDLLGGGGQRIYRCDLCGVVTPSRRHYDYHLQVCAPWLPCVAPCRCCRAELATPAILRFPQLSCQENRACMELG